MAKAKKLRADKAWVGIFAIFLVITLPVYFAFNNTNEIVNYFSSPISNELVSSLQIDDTTDAGADVSTGEVTSTKSFEFLETYSKYAPEGYSTPVVQSTGTALTSLSWICSSLSISPAPIWGYRSDTSNNVSLITQVFGAGQSLKSLDSYKSSLSRCNNNDGKVKVTSSSPRGVPGAIGFTVEIKRQKVTSYISVWARGDVIVSLAAPDLDTLDALGQSYDDELGKDLNVSACASIDVSIEDSKRSPYYDVSSYTGYLKGRTIYVPAGTPGLTLGTLSPERELVGSGVRLGTLDVNMMNPNQGQSVLSVDNQESTPLDPIPNGVPSTLPTIPTVNPLIHSIISSKPTPVPSSVNIPERIRDKVGPGCGWEWTGQSQPFYDDSVEKARVDTLVSEATETLITNYEAYAASYNSWYTLYMSLSTDISAWNNYANNFNAANSQWTRVNNVRQKYYDDVAAYNKNITDRDTFIRDQKKAQVEYDAALLSCDEEVEPSPSPSPTPSPSPSPSPTPSPLPSPNPISGTVVKTCPPVMPDILTQSIPAMPWFPTIPNIPLPSEWNLTLLEPEANIKQTPPILDGVDAPPVWNYGNRGK